LVRSVGNNQRLTLLLLGNHTNLFALSLMGYNAASCRAVVFRPAW